MRAARPHDPGRWWFGDRAQWAVLLCCLFLILFPKGGFKIGLLPITWGYILTGAYAVAALPAAVLSENRFRMKRQLVVLLLLMLPFQIILLVEATNGTTNAGLFVATMVSLIANPIMFLVIWRNWYTERNMMALLRIMRVCIAIAAIFGIFLFFYKLITGSFLEIPYLTVNSADAGDLASGKYLNRGGIYKLISTYNNGNVYGAATIILLPLYDKVERRTWMKLLLRAALLLTLSRTVWAGVLLDRMLSMGRLVYQSARQLPRIEAGLFRRTAFNLFMVGSIFAGILGITAYGDSTNAAFFGGFLTDSSLGGRIGEDTVRGDQAGVLSSFHLFRMSPMDGFSEMTFFSTLDAMGLIGFAAAILFFLAPVAVAMYDRNVMQNPIRRAALKGMVLYFMIAWVDGALDYIPVMAFYWIAAVFLIYWPQDRSTAWGDQLA